VEKFLVTASLNAGAGDAPPSYTADAADYATRIDTKVVLIDGKQLAGLMIDFDVGVAPAATYVVKRIDSDYFEES
jgi:restriction system protein